MPAARRSTPSKPHLGIGLALAFTAGCGPSETALRVKVEFGGIAIDQLEFKGDRMASFDVVRPDPPHGALASPEDLRVVLPDRLAGQMVTVTVDGLFGGTSIASGQGTTTVKK